MAHALETGTRRMRTLSWADFDRALDSAVARLASSSLSGVYGVPRGGLVLAVCLSHRLGIPLLQADTDQPPINLLQTYYGDSRR